MNISRLVSGRNFRGEKNYLRIQLKYEIARTVILFAVSISLFVAGYIATGRRENLLTIVAVLGCLPASRSLISLIMFLKSGHCDPAISDRISQVETDCLCMFDCVFTSYDKNYKLQHIAVKNSTLIGLSTDPGFKESDFRKHLTDMLKKSNIKDVTVKIFNSPDKYLDRLQELSSSANTESNVDKLIISTVLDIIL